MNPTKIPLKDSSLPKSRLRRTGSMFLLKKQAYSFFIAKQGPSLFPLLNFLDKKIKTS